MKQVYLLTYPTGKIYIGKDSIGSARYLGSPDPELVNADFQTFTDEQRQDYTIRKQILWASESATEAELSAKEVEMSGSTDQMIQRSVTTVGQSRTVTQVRDDAQPRVRADGRKRASLACGALLATLVGRRSTRTIRTSPQLQWRR
ncbi:MAG TPA: hypothetical protein VFT23_04860 [Burkholderiales bacterium]|nr:hypothetical protein [Burkholderiales bacterium]